MTDAEMIAALAARLGYKWAPPYIAARSVQPATGGVLIMKDKDTVGWWNPLVCPEDSFDVLAALAKPIPCLEIMREIAVTYLEQK